MKILHVRSSEFFGGPERAIIGQCRALKEYSFICASFVQDRSTNDFLEKCEKLPVAILPLKQANALDFRPVSTLKHAILRHNIDIVVSHDYKSNLFAKMALRNLSAHHVAHFRGRTHENLKVRFYNAIDKWILRRIDHVFVVCRSARERLIDQGVSAEKIAVIPNGYDCTRPLRAADDILPITENTEMRLISAGRLSREKGFDILIAAADILIQKQPNMHIDIYGDGPEMGPLREQTARTGLEKQVSLNGFTRELENHLHDAHILVIPSRSEGMPNVLLEAWANGLPVVATPVGGIPEMIDHGLNGFISNDVSPESLASVLLEALNNRRNLKSIGLAGQSKLRAEFSFEAQARLLNSLYKDISRQPSPAVGSPERVE